MEPNESQSGQILLITLLVLSLAVTVGLSVIGRTTIDQNISTQVEESSHAFSAAEAGIERALLTGQGSGGTQVLTPGSNVQYNVALTQIGGAATAYTPPRRTQLGEIESLWLVAHNADGTLNETVRYPGASVTVCWSQETTQAALVASLVYKLGGTYHIGRSPWDVPGVSRGATPNNFPLAAGPGAGCGKSGVYRAAITLAPLMQNNPAAIPIVLRLKPLYSSVQLTVDPGATTLPAQGSEIVSSGTTSTGVTRKIRVYQLFKSAGLPAFDSVLWSQGDISK